MSKGEALRDRTAAAITDSAAAIMAERGDAARMDTIARAPRDLPCCGLFARRGGRAWLCHWWWRAGLHAFQLGAQELRDLA